MSGKKRLIAVAVTLTSGILVLCFYDPNSKHLTSGYRRNLFEGDTYYIDRPGERFASDGGIFEGSVEELGWSDALIVAKVTRNYKGDLDGWYVLDVATRSVRGPITIEELNRDPVLSKIERYKSSDTKMRKSRIVR